MENRQMKILITGSNGLLGRQLARIAVSRGLVVQCSDKDSADSDQENFTPLDLTDREAVLSTCNELRPDTIINCAALTDVDLCEREKELASSINAEAVLHLAEGSNAIRAHLIHISTDYVFDGKKGSYREEDDPNPINHYGLSKLDGERYVRSTAKRWSIARTSVLYGWGRENRLNFATWIIKGLMKGSRLDVVTDQFASPTLNTSLAKMLLELADRRLQGTYHLAGKDRIDRFSMAVKVAEQFNLDKTLLSPTTSDNLFRSRWSARRPMDSSLNVDKATEQLESKPLDLDEALTEMKMAEEEG
jgi:dTDP-4-dehydrorhamnose reductase